MSSTYRKVDTRIWNDAKFRSLDDRAKLAFLMLLTHPSMTAVGAMRATLAGLAEELGWEPEAFREAFAQSLGKGMVEHDARACFIGLPKFLEYNRPESPNVVKAWVRSFDLLPECEHKTRLLARCRAFVEGLDVAFKEALTQAIAKAMPNQEQEQEPKQEHLSVPKGTDGAAVPPVDQSEIWKAGKSLLESQGMTRDQCGGFIGGLIKKHTEPVALEAVQLAVLKQPAEAKAWLIATCTSLHKHSNGIKSGKHSGFAAKDYSQGFAQ